MEWLAVHGFFIALWSTVFWGCVHLFDRGNVKNTFGLAVVLGAAFDLTCVLGIPVILYLVAWLVAWPVFLLWLVMRRYGLGLLAAAVVTASTVLGPSFLMLQIAPFIGHSELREDLVFYWFPLAVLGTWIATAMRKRMRAGLPAPGDDGALPSARVARGGRKRAAKPPEVAVMPVVAAPPVAAEAPAPVTPRSDGGPSFLT